VQASGSAEFVGGDLTLMSGVVHILLRCRDRLVMGSTPWRELFESAFECGDPIRQVVVDGFVFGDRRAGIDDSLSSCRVEHVEPVRDFASWGQHRCGWDGGGEFSAGGDGGQVAAVGGEDALEDIEGFAGVVGVGDDTDQVLVASAGRTDIQALAGGRVGGEGDGSIGGVGLLPGSVAA